MSCCGHNRLRLRDPESNQLMLGATPSGKATPRTTPLSLVYFVYVGKTAMTVTGPLTGRRYRFPKPGIKIAVDGDDAPSLALVPNLQQTSSP
jgi:hypothetical protein